MSRFFQSGNNQQKLPNTKYRPVCFFFFFSFWFSNFPNWASIWKRDKIQAGQSGSNYRHMFHCQQECTILLHNIDSACGWKIYNKTSKVFQKYLAIANQVFWGTQANLTLLLNIFIIREMKNLVKNWGTVAREKSRKVRESLGSRNWVSTLLSSLAEDLL